MSTFEPEKISSTFSYRRISLSLIKEIKDTIYDGESVALLGARYAGKGFIMDRIYQELTSENLTDVIWVDLPNRSPINTPEALRDTILAAVTRTSRGQSITAESNDDLFSPIDQLTKDTEKPAIVLFPYVDGIAHSLARDLQALDANLLYYFDTVKRLGYDYPGAVTASQADILRREFEGRGVGSLYEKFVERAVRHADSARNGKPLDPKSVLAEMQ